jgi:uncharacterized membrane protein
VTSVRERHSGFQRSGGRAAAFVAAVALIWGSALATQYIAAHFGYQPRLGAWVYRAPASARQMLRWALALVATAAVLAPLRATTRWYAAPLVLGAGSLYAVIAGPIYAPTRVYSWYATYGELSTYHAVFLTAWLVIAASVILVTVAAHRVRRPGSSPLAEARSRRRPEPAWWDDHTSKNRDRPLTLGSLQSVRSLFHPP